MGLAALGGEPAALVGVDNLRGTVMSEGFVRDLQAEVRVHQDGDPECKYPARAPVQRGGEMHQAPTHGILRDIHAPDLVRPVNDQILPTAAKAKVALALKADAWLRRDRLFIFRSCVSGVIMPYSGRNPTYPTVQILGATSLRTY